MEVETRGGSTSVVLRKELKLLDGVALIVGSIIGGGIFISPKGVLQGTGSVGMSLIVWVMAGLFSVFGALSYAELGTMIPKSGGDYAYINEAFGPFPSFLMIWSAFFVIYPTSQAILALTFSKYVLQPIWPFCDPPAAVIRTIAALATCSITVIQCYDVKLTTAVQKIFTGTKIVALLIIIVTGFYVLGSSGLGSLNNPMRDTASNLGDIAVGFYQAYFTYTGWNALNFVTEELRDPIKNIPRAITISLPVVVAVYILTNAAYFVVLTKNEFLASDAVAVTFGDKTLGSMSWIMPFFVACSTIGAINGGSFASSRTIFVAARDGLLPSGIGLVNVDRLTPVPALTFLCIISLALLLSSDVFALITYVTFVEIFFSLLAVVGLLWLRYRRPELHRPIKVNVFIPVIFLIITILLTVLTSISSPVEIGAGVAIIISGIPVYYIFIKWTNKPMFIKSLTESFNFLCARTFKAVVPDKQD